MEKKRFIIPTADEKLLPVNNKEEAICNRTTPMFSKIIEIIKSNEREIDIINTSFGDG
ncbi:MAG: hypothetical protein GX267_02360 [Fibrobacter sp.]|jgi:hypothetical protein|nr:hypothetical protein [Fibrobacter sp.]